MADVPEALGCALDGADPAQAEDYTNWELDEETLSRLDRLESEDIHGDEGWALRGGDE